MFWRNIVSLIICEIQKTTKFPFYARKSLQYNKESRPLCKIEALIDFLFILSRISRNPQFFTDILVLILWMEKLTKIFTCTSRKRVGALYSNLNLGFVGLFENEYWIVFYYWYNNFFQRKLLFLFLKLCQNLNLVYQLCNFSLEMK